MDPKVVAAASEHLASLLNSQPQELQGIAETMLLTGALTWSGGNSYQVHDNEATLRACPQLVSDQLLARLISSPNAWNADLSAARAELERRLIADPVIASRTESRGTNAPGITHIEDWTNQRKGLHGAVSADNLLGKSHLGNLGVHGRGFDPSGGGNEAA